MASGIAANTPISVTAATNITLSVTGNMTDGFSGQALIGNVPIEMGSNAFEPVSVQPDRTRDGLDL